MISAWLRVIRVRFLLASVIAVSVGLAITWWHTSSITIFDAILTMCGVLALHASVDLLNDYWDFKRGIDTATNRTKMSGGSGVLPEGLLKPTQVYALRTVHIYTSIRYGWMTGLLGVSTQANTNSNTISTTLTSDAQGQVYYGTAGS